MSGSLRASRLIDFTSPNAPFQKHKAHVTNNANQRKIQKNDPMSANSDSVSQPPNLQQILATLASFSNNTHGIQQSQEEPHFPPPASTAPSLSKQNNQTLIDPATITNWPSALHCIKKIASSSVSPSALANTNDSSPLPSPFTVQIRHLMHEQRQHELHWYQQRQALKKQQHERKAQRQKAMAILANLHPNKGSAAAAAATAAATHGTNVATGFPTKGDDRNDDDVEEEEEEEDGERAARAKELREFDRRIHLAQRKLDDEHERKLKSMGVPFFGMDPSLIAVTDSTSSLSSSSSTDKVDDKIVAGNDDSGTPRLSEKQWRELRAKMIAWLEDYVRSQPPAARP